MHSVYFLICPNSRLVKWVGVSSNLKKRLSQHLENRKKDGVKNQWILNLKAEGKKPEMVCVASFDDREKAEEVEEFLIREMKDGGLLNSFIGKKWTDEQRKKWSEYIKANPFSEEATEKMRQTIRSKEYREKHDPRLLAYNEERKVKIQDQFGAVYESMHDAERKTGCKRPSIKAVLTGKHKQTKGFIFSRLLIVALVLFSHVCHAALPPTRSSGQSDTLSTTFDFQAPYSQVTKTSGTAALFELDSYNILKNPRFEATDYSSNWTASGGTLAAAATTNIFFGKGATWDGSAAAQTLTTTAVAVPEGFKGNNCEASIYVKVPSGTATHTLEAYDGTNILATATLVNSVYFTKNTLTFPCPTSGNISLRLVTVASDEPLIALDEAYLGLARNVGVVNLTTKRASYSPTFNSTTGHAASNGWWYRDGDRLVAGGSILWNGTGAVSNFTATLPSACTIDTAKLNDSTASSLRNYVGWWSWYDDSGGLSINPQRVRVNSTSTISLMDGSNSVISNIFGNNDRIAWRFEVPCVGWSASQVVMPDAQGWFVAGEITGANPSLGVASVTSYTELANGSLTLTPQAGSAPIGIMCSSTNAAATPSSSATTCSAGSESVGFNANFPRSGVYEICAEFAHQAEVDSGEGLRATFQVIQTPTNAQTLSQEAGSKVTSGLTGMTIASGVASAVNIPHTRCGFFTLSAGINGFRLMYEQIVGGTPNSSLVLADASVNEGQRGIRWSAKPVTSQQQALLANSVSTRVTNGVTEETAIVTCSSSSSIDRQLGTWVSSVGNISSGVCAVTVNGFNGTPYCDVNGWGAGVSNVSVRANCSSSTACEVSGYNTATGVASTGFTAKFSCKAQR